MIIAYILKKSRVNKIKMILKEGQRFKKGSLTYDIDPEAIYLKKFLGIKLFRFSQYMEGVKQPIIFDFKKETIIQRNIHIDYIAQLMAKLKFLKLEIIILVLLVFIMIIGLVNYAQVTEAFKNI